MRNSIIEEDLSYIAQQNINWNKFQDKTVLVTGANGFLPAYMVESLLYQNERNPNLNIRVIGLVRNKEKANNRFAYYKDRTDLSFVVQDVAAPIKVDSPIDYIIHAASQASPKYFRSDPVGTLKANTLGTINLLELARKQSLESFLFFSSAEIYGTVDAAKLPLDERSIGITDPLNVLSCYGESKRMGETICISYMHQYNIPCKIVRPFHVYGPGIGLDDGRAFVDFVHNIIDNKDIVLHTAGAATRDYIYLADATEAFFKILLDGKVGEVFNVATGKETSIFELVTMLVDLFPEKKLHVRNDDQIPAGGYMKAPTARVAGNFTKIKSQLGWQWRYPIKEGFKRMVLSYGRPTT